MDISDPETLAMLHDARAKAERLIDELLKQQAEVEANPATLSPEQLEAGRRAFEKAINSAKRMLKNLDEAQRIAAIDKN